MKSEGRRVKSEAKYVNTIVLSLFHPLIQKRFSEKVGAPTDVQEKAWPEIAKGVMCS